MQSNLSDLIDMLQITPVMGQFHPLVTLCLPQDVEIISAPEQLAEELDSIYPHVERPILITRLDKRWLHRFTISSYPFCPPATEINQYLPGRIDVARQCLLTSHNVAEKISKDARERKYDCIILLLVDGLSYADIIDWPEQTEPCFIDGPSITFSRTPEQQIDLQVGFPSIVGTPPLSTRLGNMGFRYFRGFSYWDRGQNDVTETLFKGVPLEKISQFSEAYSEIEKLDCQSVYIQIIREGLDGLAHNRREVSKHEIQATTKSIHQDFRDLVNLLAEKEVRGAVYLVSDHGILWKNQHDFQVLECNDKKHPRYATSDLLQPEYTTKFATQLQEFYLWQYPFLGRSIRSNDSGVHGGLSYWESIVPFVQVEVNT